MAEFSPRKEISREICCCRCCNSDIFLKNLPINLFGSISSTEKIILHIERLTGTKIEENDGLFNIFCRLCYVKIDSYQKFLDTFNKANVQSKSAVRFKRKKSLDESLSSAEGTSPSGRHVRKKEKYGEENVAQVCAPSKTRVPLFATPHPPSTILPSPSKAAQDTTTPMLTPIIPVSMTPILPAPIPASTPQPNETEGSKKRVLASSLLPNHVQKQPSKSSAILSTADLRNPKVTILSKKN